MVKSKLPLLQEGKSVRVEGRGGGGVEEAHRGIMGVGKTGCCMIGFSLCRGWSEGRRALLGQQKVLCDEDSLVLKGYKGTSFGDLRSKVGKGQEAHERLPDMCAGKQEPNAAYPLSRRAAWGPRLETKDVGC